MHLPTRMSLARQFQIDIAARTAAIRKEIAELERKALGRTPWNDGRINERAFLFEQLAELRLLVSQQNALGANGEGPTQLGTRSLPDRTRIDSATSPTAGHDRSNRSTFQVDGPSLLSPSVSD